MKDIFKSDELRATFGDRKVLNGQKLFEWLMDSHSTQKLTTTVAPETPLIFMEGGNIRNSRSTFILTQQSLILLPKSSLLFVLVVPPGTT